jgi:hypothetical protein
MSGSRTARHPAPGLALTMSAELSIGRAVD